MAQLLTEIKRLIEAVEEYLNYEHSGDPFEEDSRVMGEMAIDDFNRDGSLEKLKQMVYEKGQSL